MKTLIDCKDEVARNHGFDDWLAVLKFGDSIRCEINFHELETEVAKLYAHAVATDALNRAANNAKLDMDLGRSGDAYPFIVRGSITDPLNIVLP